MTTACAFQLIGVLMAIAWGSLLVYVLGVVAFVKVDQWLAARRRRPWRVVR